VSGQRPTWTAEDAATLEALLDRLVASRPDGVEVARREPAMARADLKGRHEVSARPEWDLRRIRELDGSFLTRLLPYDRKLSDKIEEVRRVVDEEARDRRHDLFITTMRCSRIPIVVAAVKKQLRSMGRGG